MKQQDKRTKQQDEDRKAMNKAYKEAGANAYFHNGFRAGLRHARKAELIEMTFAKAPVGARFKFIEEKITDDVYVKLSDSGDGLIVKWKGNTQGHQSHCYDIGTKILVING